MPNITFRTYYRTAQGETVAVRYGADLINNLKNTGNNIWEKSFRNIRIQANAIFSFNLVICNGEGQILRSEQDGVHRQVIFSNGNSFLLETNWEQPEVRVFPRTGGLAEEVTIRICTDQATDQTSDEKLFVLGNCVTLGNGNQPANNEMKWDSRTSTWQLKIQLHMMLHNNQWMLPVAVNPGLANPQGFEPLSLKLGVLPEGQQTIQPKPDFEPKPKLLESETRKYELHCSKGKCWVDIKTQIERDPMHRDVVMTLLCNTLNWHLPILNGNPQLTAFKDVKQKYALCLVPMITLGGGYDGRTRTTSGAPHTFHDIWGDGLDDEADVPVFAGGQFKVRSAIEYVQLRKEKNLRGNRVKVCQRLSSKYHARQGNVHNLFVGAGEQEWSQFLQGNHSDPEYKTALIKLAHWVRDINYVPNKEEGQHHFLLQLFRHSAAIVRGRMEASLVSKECDVMHSDWYRCWKSHMEVAACWFVLMMAAWRRLERLLVRRQRNFRKQLKEFNEPFYPNFYGFC